MFLNNTCLALVNLRAEQNNFLIGVSSSGKAAPTYVYPFISGFEQP